MSKVFEERYLNLVAWIREYAGWIEIGRDEFCRSLGRVLDMGGMVWESEDEYQSIDEALAETDKAIADWMASSHDNE